jgi:glycine/D-amino acid oxidase-like deaminating enzyme
VNSYDVLIIGAGIVGCACALECAREGQRVAVVERGNVGGGVTAAGMGHVVVMDDSPAQLALTAYSRLLWNRLSPELPPQVEYEPRGTIWIAAKEDELGEIASKQKAYSSIGVASQVLDARQLAQAEPYLRSGLAGGLLVPDDSVIYPPAAAAYLLEQAIGLGAVSLRGYEVVKIEHEAVRMQNGELFRAGKILLASGADTQLLPWLPIQKRKGHLLITDRYPGMVSHQLVELGYLASAHQIAADSVAFNLQPRQTGQILIGSSRQYGSEHAGVDAGILKRMLDRAIEYMPSLRQVSGIRVWTGFRAASEDKLPLIGPSGEPSLFLAMGFEGLGITNALGAARLAVDALLGRASAIDRRPYLPERFEKTRVLGMA